MSHKVLGGRGVGEMTQTVTSGEGGLKSVEKVLCIILMAPIEFLNDMCNQC
jgi:hypothetical protein